MSEVTLLKALGYWRKQHFPTYLALRFIALSGPSVVRALVQRLDQRPEAFSSLRSRAHPQFKSSEDGHPEYRDCVALSPTTALVEALVIQQIQTAPAFTQLDTVYSYRRATPDSGNLFAYFARDYDARNLWITKALGRSKDAVVAVFDMVKFYPSVNAATACERLQPSLRGLEPTKVANINAFLNSVVESSSSGALPVGPAICHVLANSFLAGVDYDLARAFPGRYTRYVDDLVIVCARSDIKAVQRIVRERIEREGLRLHPDKTTVIDGTLWRAHSPLLEDASETNADSRSLSTLSDRIQHYLWAYPDRWNALADLFAQHDLPLPLQQFRAVSRYSRWQRTAKGRIIERIKGGLKRFLGFLAGTEAESLKSLLQYALELRSASFMALEALNSKPVPRGIQRRWWAHRIKKQLTCSLYLSPVDVLPLVFEQIPDDEEFASHQAVFQALMSRDVGPILDLCGFPAQTLGSLWRAHGHPSVPLDPQWLTHPARLNAVCELACYGVIRANAQEKQSRILTASDSAMLAFATLTASRRTLRDFSYEDEMESLATCQSRLTLEEVHTSRFNDQDPIEFEGQWLAELSSG